MSQVVILGALELGGIFAVLSLGLYISYKVLNIPDLTVDGSFTLGTAISAVFTMNSMPYPWYSSFVCFWACCRNGNWVIDYKVENYAVIIRDSYNDWFVFYQFDDYE